MREFSTDPQLRIPDLNTIEDILGNINSDIRLQVGQYTGNGFTNHDILTRISPIAVLIFSATNTVVPIIWTKLSGISKDFDGNNVAAAILGLSPNNDGFRLGTAAQVNANTIVFDYIALGT